MKINAFNLISGINQTRFIVEHCLCSCKCELIRSVYNWKQKWNRDECRCECKESDEWSSCEKDYMWDPSTSDCKCNKGNKIDEYFDTKHFSCKKWLISKLVLECQDEMLNTTETSPNDNR